MKLEVECCTLKRINLMTTLAIAIMALTLVIGCGGSSGGGGGSSTSDLVGTWTMASTKGTVCPNCLMLTFNADGTGAYTDRKGDWLGAKQTVAITWSASGGILHFAGAGIDATVPYSVVSADPDQLVLTWDDGAEIFVRVNQAPN